MEDLNLLAADCVVISCCCQCLILQILIFVLLKLPCKFVKKTREYAKKKLQQKKRDKKVMKKEKGSSSYIEEIVRIHELSLRIEGDRAFEDVGGHNCGCCLEEVEKVMEELSRRGEFAFGSFWGREGPWPWGVPKTVTKDHSGDDGFVSYQIIEIVGSMSSA
ncbi:hypothetical protein L6164_001814 [Bauhinia variegata]|uniref:Uncharacterized protein n=1 Tax=Bauhinia variegata TaxID=167791 RepID=A0ACB9QAV0_BAUVA|nr:hypothetical protein L6164_001814 [Bauhinia variegata]